MFQTTFLRAQEIDNTTSFEHINGDRYIRLTGDDDYLSGTDEQYTEGLNLEICAPWVKKFPLSRLLLHPPLYNVSAQYGISIEQEGYTPANLTNEAIATNDRPFAATLYLNTFLITTDYRNRQRFATMISTGVIGPSALGMQLQDGAHNILNDVVPPGWKYQIHDDVILNYELNYEMELYSAGHAFSLSADAMSRIGTLDDKICPGLTIMAGHFESPFSTSRLMSAYQIFVYDHPDVSFVGYDATLQGGVFDNSSPYTLPANDIARIVFKNRSGLVLVHRRFRLEYYHVFQTQQFINGGREHSWDGLQLATTFR